MEDSTNLTALKRDIEDIENLQAELLTMDTEEEVDANLNGVTELKGIKQEKPDFGSDIIEVEIETEHAAEETNSEVKELVKPIVTSTPLKAIAPKPFVAVPKTSKTNLISPGGQQIVLLQSPGGTANAVSLTTGQPIKILTQSGQPVNLSQFQTGRSPTLIKSSDGHYIFRPMPPTKTAVTAASNIVKQATGLKQRIVPSGVVQQKKIIVSSGQATKPETGGQMVKIITSSANTLTSPTKTISIEQAKEMGLLNDSQIQQLLPQGVGKQIILNKTQVKPQLIKVASNQVSKSPAKILPAPRQKVIIKQGGQLKTGIINTPPLLRIPAGQLNSAAGQIHQISIPGQAVQYVRLVNASPSSVTTAATTVATSVSSLIRSTAVVTGATTTTTTSNSQVQTQPKLSTVVPVALINRGTNNAGVIKVLPISSASQTPIRPVAPKTSTTQRVLVPSTAASTAKISVSTPVTTIQGTTLIPTSPVNQSIVMVPTQYVQLSPDVSRSNVPKTTIKMEAIKREIVTSPEPSPRNSLSGLDSNGLRPRKPCNCTKSQCLKLYCDCFANGEFCNMCNCVHCFNNLENEENRQQAIRNCLERNPSAFRPKIGKGKDLGDQAIRRHTKGCNCKRSGCLKNYCECYEAKIACSNNCKCFGCRNIEESLEKKTLRPIAPMINFDILEQLGIKSPGKLTTLPTIKNSLSSSTQPDANYRPTVVNNSKQPFTFMTTEVIEATVQCLLASAELAVRNELPPARAEKQVLEEFGRCLVEIIQTAHNESGESTS